MKSCIVITGGGTGGHVFPALAVAEELARSWDGRMVWIGSPKGVEKDIVARWGMEFHGIPTGKLRRYISLENLIDLFKTLGGVLKSISLLKKLKPLLVFSKGGFVSVPPVLAARLLKIPVVSHESDYDPGLATRINAKSSRRVCVPYAESLKFFAPGQAVATGNPIRAEIAKGDAAEGLRMLGFEKSDKPVLFVQGGSLGAKQVNDLIRESIDTLTAHFRIVHQRGNGEWDLADRPGTYVSRPFFSAEYPHVLAAADIVVSRAGAGSIWELGFTAKPAVLVPLESGTRGDQIRNADLCERTGTALVYRASAYAETGAGIPVGGSGGNAGTKAFSDMLVSLAEDRSRRELMAGKWRTIVHGDGARNVAAQLLEILSTK